jgi:hypothetical protein
VDSRKGIYTRTHLLEALCAFLVRSTQLKAASLEWPRLLLFLDIECVWHRGEGMLQLEAILDVTVDTKREGGQVGVDKM